MDLLWRPRPRAPHRPLPPGPHPGSGARRRRPQPVPGSRQHRWPAQRHRHPPPGREARPARLAHLRHGVRGRARLADRNRGPGLGAAFHHDRPHAPDGVGAGPDHRRRRRRRRPGLCRGTPPGRCAQRCADPHHPAPGRPAHAGQYGEPRGGGARSCAGRRRPGRSVPAGDRSRGPRRRRRHGRLAAAHRQDLCLRDRFRGLQRGDPGAGGRRLCEGMAGRAVPARFPGLRHLRGDQRCPGVGPAASPPAPRRGPRPQGLPRFGPRRCRSRRRRRPDPGRGAGHAGALGASVGGLQ